MNKLTGHNPQNSTIKFCIVGYGPFGKVFTDIIAAHADVAVVSRRKLSDHDLPKNVAQIALEEAANYDVIVLANELGRIEEDCKKIAKSVNKNTIVMDVCSVKIKPANILADILGSKCQIVATHPLFGPQSIENTNAKGKLIVWHELSNNNFGELKAFLSEKLGLVIKEMSPDEHDREMAWVHALSFFIGRGLLNVSPPRSELATNYYQQLRKLHDIEAGHSLELFRTIQLANPYAKKVRDQFLRALEVIESDLETRSS